MQASEKYWLNKSRRRLDAACAGVLVCGIFTLLHCAALAQMPSPADLGVKAIPAGTGVKSEADSAGADAGVIKKGPALPPCLAAIAKATTVEDGTLRAGKLRESLLAAERLAPTPKDALLDLVQTATPAGRLIALALLRKSNIVDSTAYQKLAEDLKTDIGNESVSYISPSERCHYSVSDILNDLASSHPLIKMLP